MLTAAIYARYSSEHQRATSTEDQITLCRSAASRFGVAVRDEYVYRDEELSAATGHRPAYQRLLAFAKERRFGAILVESQDRLWRNQGEMHHALERLTFWGVRVFSVATGGDLTDRTGRLVASVMGWKDEAFLADLRDKTRRGMAGQVSRGLSVGGRAYGYRSEPVVNEAGVVVGSRKVIDSTEADTVRRIFRWYAEGMNPRAIVHRLNAEQVAPPRSAAHRRVRGWTPATLFGASARALGILNNPLYVGRMVWNRSQKVRDPDTGKRFMRPRPQQEWVWTDVPALRIVSDALWNDVQQRRRQRQYSLSGHSGGARPKYLLTGLLECGECSAHYVINSKHTGQHLYGCAAHKERGPMVCTNGKTVRREVLEAHVLDWVFVDLFAPHRLAYLSQAVDEAFARAMAHPDTLIEERGRALAQARAELGNIADAIRHGIRTPTTRAILEEAEQRVASLEAALAAAKRKLPAVEPFAVSVDRYLTDLRATVNTNPDKARRLLSRGIDRIVLQREGTHLVATLHGNLAGVLRIGENAESGTVTDGVGAGRGI